jgi:hypothetical protein
MSASVLPPSRECKAHKSMSQDAYFSFEVAAGASDLLLRFLLDWGTARPQDPFCECDTGLCCSLEIVGTLQTRYPRIQILGQDKR